MTSEEHEVVQFELSKQLGEKINGVFYETDNNTLKIYLKSSAKARPLQIKVDKSSMRRTLEQFTERVNGTLDTEIKKLCVYSIKFHLRKFIEFNNVEQKWYSDNYPDDPSLGQKKKNLKRKKSKKKIRKKVNQRKFLPINILIMVRVNYMNR